MVVPADYLSSAITGFVIALVSWLPLGIGGAAVSHFLGAVARDYQNYIVPSYLGVIFAVIFYFRDLISIGTRKALVREFSAEARYFAYAAVFTVAIGYPIAAGGWNVVDPAGSDAVNALIGLAIIAVGLLCWKKKAPLKDVEDKLRNADEPTLLDAVSSGVSQGFAMLGEISAAGLVLLALSAGGIKPKKALGLLFMVYPVYLVLRLIPLGEWTPAMPVYLPFTAFLSSFVTAILFMKALLLIGERLSRRTFLTLMGLIPIVVYLMEVML